MPPSQEKQEKKKKVPTVVKPLAFFPPGREWLAVKRYQRKAKKAKSLQERPNIPLIHRVWERRAKNLVKKGNEILAENIRPLEFKQFAGLGGLVKFKPLRTMRFAGFTEVPRRLLPGKTIGKVYQEVSDEKKR